ncbi:MAG: hypothetical protein ACRDIX_11275 [Actinomycetota bacterium]
MKRMIAVGAFLALVFAFALPALAHHKPDHANGKGSAARSGGSDNDGDADSSSATSMEDPHTADAGDNHHPSGKDKSYEAGGSGNQGKSESDPDGDENGGVDKPGGSATAGGDTDDQDGNNGCGNDDDFEDDNNGNCLRRGQQGEEGGGDVGGGDVGGGDVGGEAVTGGEVAVLGITATRGAGVAGQAQLAVTGLELQALLALALGLMIAGGTVVLVTRKSAS